MKECERETRVVKIKLCAVSLARSRSAFACPEPQRSFCPASWTVVSHRPDPGPRLRKLPLTPPHTATARHGIAQSGPFTLCTGSAAPIPTTQQPEMLCLCICTCRPLSTCSLVSIHTSVACCRVSPICCLVSPCLALTRSDIFDRDGEIEGQSRVCHNNVLTLGNEVRHELLKVALGLLEQRRRGLEEQRASVRVRERGALDLARKCQLTPTVLNCTYNSCLSSIHATSFSSVQSFPTSAVTLSPPHTGQSGRFSCSNVNVYRLSLPTY